MCNARAHASARESDSRQLTVRATLSLGAANTQQHTAWVDPGVTRAVDYSAKMSIRVQKSVEMFGSFEFSLYLCAMDEAKYVITGVNALTRAREEISRPMSYSEAEARLERELASRRHQRYQPYKRLRIEKRIPVELFINFPDYE